MNTTSYRLITRVLFTVLALCGLAGVQAQDQKTEFGPYVALVRDTNIVRDVKVEENGRIYLLLNPDFKEKEIILKNSMVKGEAYRKWFTGEVELISAANQGKAPDEYTDWVTSSANYIEYHMDGKLILHLGKKTVVNN